MDAFYASIEQRDNPDLRGKPVAVGYSGDRGVVASASYEARRYGVKSAMPSKTAFRKCPDLIFTRARFEVYESVSEQIMNIFHDYTDLVEPLSLDEAFLDVTQNFKDIPYATQIAKEIKTRIFEETRLTASAGVAYNKFLAKIASDYNKPNGLFVIKPDKAEKFVEDLPIELFFGVGKVTAKRMHQVGIRNGLDLKMRSEEELVRLFGRIGQIYYLNSRAIDYRSVEPNRIRKSIGAETTFAYDLETLGECNEPIEEIALELLERIKESSFEAKTITLKVKYATFKTITRSKTLPFYITSLDTIKSTAIELMSKVDMSPKVRLLGLSVKKNDNLMYRTEAIQLSFDFED